MQFQLPPSHEGERQKRLDAEAGAYFNSRPRMRANGRDFIRCPFWSEFQLPPSHEGELKPILMLVLH